MRKPKVLVFSAKGKASLNALQIENLEKVASANYKIALTPYSDIELINSIQAYDFIAITRRVTKDFHNEIIEKLPQLKGISIYATGTDWLDVRSLNENKIQLKILKDYSTLVVAEHTIGMLLTLSRRIHLSDRIARGDLTNATSIRGWELADKTIGIVGFGKIGRRVAELASAFGMSVIYYDPIDTNEDIAAGFISSSYQDLLRKSDVIVLTASMDRLSTIIINEIEISLMKQEVNIINSSRSALVEKDAIYRALSSKRIQGYAVDDFIFSQEEISRLEAGRLLQTGHSAWYSNEAMVRGTEMWINNLIEMIKNE